MSKPKHPDRTAAAELSEAALAQVSGGDKPSAGKQTEFLKIELNEILISSPPPPPPPK